jgi:hypothetical protein
VQTARNSQGLHQANQGNALAQVSDLPLHHALKHHALKHHALKHHALKVVALRAVELANQLGQHQKPIGVGQQQQRDRREKQSRSREFHKKKRIATGTSSLN